MPQTINIGTSCFVRLHGRVYPGIVVGFGSDAIKGPLVTVETEAASLIYRPWKRMSFLMRDCTGFAARHCLLEVAADEAQLARLLHEVENPPIDDRIKWLAAQAGELPLAPKRVVSQFPIELER
jgi:hypothetical protein